MMSKINKTVFVLAVMFLLLAVASVQAIQERVDITIDLKSGRGGFLVTGRIIAPDGPELTNLSFLDKYADAFELAKRVYFPRVTDESGNKLSLKRFNRGEYLSEKPFTGFAYIFDPQEPKPLIAAPHVSWQHKGLYLLKMKDLLPDIQAEAYRIKFGLGSHWNLATSEKRIAPFEFESIDIEDAVFLVEPQGGNGFRILRRKFRGTRIEIAIADKWQFKDELIAEMALEILDEYAKLFGAIPRDRIQINLLRFPTDIGKDRWRAQTQGGTITIVSSKSTYENLAEQRLHEQLRHELFHLWIPEAVNLKGDYAWFYEGFAQYQSLKSGVWVGRLRFEDFLKSMSEAINIAAFDRSKLPLTELSLNRWQVGPGVVSARGMAVAFLCDVILLKETKRKRNVGDLLRNIFRNHAVPAAAVDAREALESELSKYPGLRQVVERRINANESVDWASTLKPFGIDVGSQAGRVRLNIASKPTRDQKALLRKLGYNRWKSLPRS